jgi:hypothetical protein
MPTVLDRQAEAFGADAISLQTSVGPAWIVASAKNIPADLRDSAFFGQAKDFRYYQLLEDSLREQFSYRYFVLNDEASGAWAIQPLFFVQQDLLAGLPAAFRSLVAPIRKLWPGFFKLRMMTIGCAAGEGELDSAEPWAVTALREMIAAFRLREKASIILLKDFPSIHRSALADLSRDGFQRAPSMPAARLDLDFGSFEEYMMEKLGKVFRKNLRRKFRALEGAPPITMEVLSDASEIVDEIFPLHMQTFDRSELKFEELNKDFFRLIGQRMPDRVRYFVWRQNGRIIAFNLCLVHGGTLHDLDVGLDYAVALDLHLYFVTWRDVIQWCLENGVKTYHTGPLNYDPKLHLKLTLAPLDLYARHGSALANPFFKLAIKYLEPTRHDPLLRRFSNANELH